ncbi:MAG TPA: condensation domain-containing protein, partial [Thermoanaerobaculia bacterium]|nr:condensation domain-containing protein [Thermoanaerobaculia bacterium]
MTSSVVHAEVFVAEASFAQQRIWLIDRLIPGQPTYNVPLGLRARGALGRRALETALAGMTERHEILRTAFDEEEGEPVQLIWSALAVPLPWIDLSALPAGLREREGHARLDAEAARPFDLKRPPLWRAAVFQLGPEDHLLLFNFNHTVTDEWSNGLFLRELLALYGAAREGRPAALPDPPLQYADFAAWQRQWLQGTALERRLGVMGRRLAGIPEALALPADFPRPAPEDPSGNELSFELPAPLAAGLRELARGADATLFMVLLAGLEALLFRLTGQRDFAVGSPVANRTRVETESVLGLFVNTVALRAEMGDDLTFRDHLARVRTIA